MISSDYSTAEIPHFINKCCFNTKLVINRDIKIDKIEMDYSWANIHITCLAFNKFTVFNRRMPKLFFEFFDIFSFI